MKTVVVLLCLFLSACGTTKYVQVPIPVKCETPEPNEPTLRYSPPYDDIFSAVKDLLGDREAQSAHTTELKAALRSCK